jgi:microcystin-dependent protein
MIGEYSDFTIEARYNYIVTKWVAEIYHLEELVYTGDEYDTEYEAREAAFAHLTSNIEALLGGVVTDESHDSLDHSVALGTAILDDLGDVTAPSPNASDIIVRSGGAWVSAAQTAIDHGSIGGLGDDDHSQYHNDARHDAHDHSTALSTTILDDVGDVVITGAASTHILLRNGSSQWVNSAQTGIDHGSISGLADDDHTQYLNTTRHDAHDHTTALGTAALDDLGDVTIAAPAATHVIIRNGGNTAWENSAQSGIDHGSIGGLGDDDHTQYTRKDTLTTKGDIYAATAASTPDRRAVGTDKQVLVADSAQGTGLNWGWVGVPTGAIMQFGSHYLPTDWLECDGTAANRTTYATLFAAIVPVIGTFTVTIASPGVVTLNSHGLQEGDAIYLTTTGALPTGLSQNTIYYVKIVNANSFQLSLTRTTAGAGTAINTTGSQSGVHTLRYCPWGLGDGSTTFNLPNFTQRLPVGRKTTTAYVPQGMFDAHVTTDNGSNSGSHNHTGSLSGSSGGQSVTHTHIEIAPCDGNLGSKATGNASADHTHTLSAGTVTINTTNSTHTHTVYGIGVTWMIKT